MTTATNQPAPATGLDSLASQAQQLQPPPMGEGTTDLDVSARSSQEQAEQAEAVRKLEASVQAMMFGLLKLARNAIAKRLPEIREEWPDELLQPPAAAIVPIIKKRMESVMQLAGKDPDIAILVVTMMPLALGAFNAWERAQQRMATEGKDNSNPPASLDGPA